MSFEFPFEYADVDELGTLFYPIVQLKLKTIYGWRAFEFLVDTGADVTTVPAHLLPVLGLTKLKLPTSQTLGVGGVAVKTWNFTLPMKLGTYEFHAASSAVETRSDTIPLLLGKKDVFESKLNLTVDSRRKVTVLTLNE